MQLAQSAITAATSKLVFVQIQFASIASSSDSSLSRRRNFLFLLSSLSVSLGSISHVLVRSIMGWQIVVHADGTSSARSSSAKVTGMAVASPARNNVGCIGRRIWGSVKKTRTVD